MANNKYFLILNFVFFELDKWLSSVFILHIRYISGLQYIYQNFLSRCDTNNIWVLQQKPTIFFPNRSKSVIPFNLPSQINEINIFSRSTTQLPHFRMRFSKYLWQNLQISDAKVFSYVFFKCYSTNTILLRDFLSYSLQRKIDEFYLKIFFLSLSN